MWALGHVAPVRRLWFSPDGQRLVSVGDDRTVRVWDVPATRPFRTFPIEPETVDAWALTPDGSTLVGIDDRLTVHRWPLDADQPKSTFDLREAQKLDIGLRVREAHVLPDGTLAVLALAAPPEYRLIRYSFSLWDLADRAARPLGRRRGERLPRRLVRLSPDGRLAAGSEATLDTGHRGRVAVPAPARSGRAAAGLLAGRPVARRRSRPETPASGNWRPADVIATCRSTRSTWRRSHRTAGGWSS